MTALWLSRRHSTKSALRQQKEFLDYSYARLHCAKARFLETCEEGILSGCNCGCELTAWQQFTSLMEIDKHFILATRFSRLVLPKAAFQLEADRTEFRTLVSEKLSQQIAVARSVEFTCTSNDWRNARWLEFKLGGWLRLFALFSFACIEAVTSLYLVTFYGVEGLFTPQVWAGACCFAALLLALVPLFQKKPVRPIAQMKVSFADDAIYIQSAASLSRVEWSRVKGIVADKNCIVLAYEKKLMLLIPQRSIHPVQRPYLAEILETKLAPKHRIASPAETSSG